MRVDADYQKFVCQHQCIHVATQLLRRLKYRAYSHDDGYEGMCVDGILICLADSDCVGCVARQTQ